MVGCGAEGDDSRAPITTVEAPLDIETAGRELDEEREDEADVAEDGEGKGEDRGKGKDKEKGKARGHDKKDER